MKKNHDHTIPSILTMKEKNIKSSHSIEEAEELHVLKTKFRKQK